MTDIPDALVQRMVALIGNLKDPFWRVGITGVEAINAEARAIVAELPKPIDPDLLEARKIAIEILVSHDQITFRPNNTLEWRKSIEAGTDDKHPVVQCTLAALKRGKELARSNPHEGI